MSNPTAAQNLLSVFSRNATAAVDADWYLTAHDECARRADRLNIGRRAYCGITAALSPQNAWDTPSGKTPNLDLADSFIATRRNVHTAPQQHKAEAILAGADPLDVLQGDKETSFYLNLTEPGATPAVTVDRWHARAAGLVGRLTAKRYRDIRDATRTAAAAVGLSPDAFQAAVWAQMRRESTNPIGG